MKSYLSGREQMVVYAGVESRKMAQDIGIVQGSRLGPLLYDIYSNDFNWLCSSDENILYADDTCLIYVGDNLETLTQHVNNRLAIIDDWCNANKLYLNRSKCEYMLITNRVLQATPNIHIANDKLSQATSFKYLGVIIDQSLKFQPHIEALMSRLSQVCGASFRLKHHLNLIAAKKMYYACFYSIATYCIGIYGGTMLCTHRCDRLVRLQAKIMKNLFSKFFPSTRCLFKKIKILKLPDVYRLKVNVFMYRMLKLDEFPSIRRNLRLEYATLSYGTRYAGNLIPPFPRVEAIRINFQYQFINVWNSTPLAIKALPNFRSFKRALIDFYLNSY